ncbi:MAG TPA: hypothetical protein VJA94_18670 [Candidatus Angelobacter sp.]
MKKVICTVLLTLTTIVAVAQSQPTSQPAQNTAANKKVIQDPAEYDAYVKALGMQDPRQKAAAMEAFIQQYPKSIVKSDALDQLLAAYTAVPDRGKLEDTATRILKDDPNNVKALAITTDIERGKGTPESIAAAGQNAQKGLQALDSWTKPEGMSDADFAKVKDQMAEIFNGAAGFAALQAKDYAAARNFYLKSVQKDPNNLQDVYQLALTDLNMTPLNLEGFWYGAKAINLAAGNPETANAIARDIKYRYKKYHGKADDWDKFAATVASQTAPPADMAALIPPAPTPCDLAVNVVKENRVEDLNFQDLEFVLAHANCSPANKDAADKAWQAVLNKQKTPDGAEARLKLPAVLVISADKQTLQAAISDENQEAKKADLTVMFEKPVLHPPATGTTVDVVGSITKYAPDPFMFTMEQGTIPAKPQPGKRPVHHAANRKPPR